LLSGTYTAEILGSSGALGSFTFTVVAGETTDVGTIDVQTGGMEGSVYWNGAPVSGLGIESMFVAFGGLAGTYLDANGCYSFVNVAPGTYTLNAYSEGCTLDTIKIGTTQATVVANSTTTANIDITATTGRVIGAVTVNGVPFP